MDPRCRRRGAVRCGRDGAHDHLLHVGQRSYADRSQSGVIAHWQHAADAVRAASDLLATHLDSWGTTRAPESEVLNDPAVGAAGFGELASLAVPVAGAADALGRQLRDSGATLREVEHLVPRTGPLREAAVTSRGLAQLGGLGRPLAELQVAQPAVRDQHPIVELQDRVARLHRVWHQLTREDWVGVGTLADLAVAGILLNGAAAKALRAGAPTDVPALSIQREARRFEAGAAAWLEVHGQIRVLRTATPAIAVVRADVVAVRELLKELEQAKPTREAQAALVGGSLRRCCSLQREGAGESGAEWADLDRRTAPDGGPGLRRPDPGPGKAAGAARACVAGARGGPAGRVQAGEGDSY